MKAGKSKPTDDLRMSSKEFDRIMGQALRVKPEAADKAKRRKVAKTKPVDKARGNPKA